MKPLHYQQFTKNLIVGLRYDNEVSVWRWDNSAAIAVIGTTGSGKTENTAYWLTQLACQGVRLAICDPHHKDKQSLTAKTQHLRQAYLEEPITEYSQYEPFVRSIYELGKARLDDPTLERYPIMVAIDEFTSYILQTKGAAKTTVTLLNDAVNQYRKVDIRFILIGQQFGEAVRITSNLRDAISSAFILKCSHNDSARFTNKLVTTGLQPGQVLYEDQVCLVPRLTATDRLVATDRILQFSHTDYTRTTETHTFPVAAVEYSLRGEFDSPSLSRRGIYYIAVETPTHVGYYIGKTSRSFATRWKEHQRDLIEGIHVNKTLREDFAAGYRCVAGILQEVEYEDLDAKEREYIEWTRQRFFCYNIA